MAYESLKQEIRQYIKTNGQNEITGQILQDVLIDMVNQYPSLDGYATQQWVESQNYISEADLANYATQAWVSQNFLALVGGTMTGDLTFRSGNGISVYYQYGDPSDPEYDVILIKDGVVSVGNGGDITIGGNSVWHAGNFNPSDYMPSTTAIINSVVGDELGHLTLTGPNFPATVLDFSHQHRWEELIDVPTNLRDLGITEEYLPLTGGTMTGSIRFTADQGIVLDTDNSILVDSADSSLCISAYDSVKFFIDSTQKVSIDSTAITAPSFIKSGGTSSQFLKADGSIDSNVYITSSALSGYATQSWVSSNYAAQSWVSSNYATQSTVNGLSYINGVTSDGLGRLTLTGHNFEVTVLDLSHQHRWEELIDVPTSLRDLGITEEYLPLSAGSSYPLTGDLYLGANMIRCEYTVSPYSYSAHLDTSGLLVTKAQHGVVEEEYYVDVDCDKITLYSYLEALGDTETHSTVITPSGITIDGNSVATQSWVGQQGYLTSSSLSGYATQSWVSSNYATQSWVSNNYATQSTVNGLSYINGVALNGDGSLSLTGHSFTTTILDMTHQHRWEELTDRPLIDMWNDTMVAVNGIVSSGKIGAGVSATPSYMLEVVGQAMIYSNVGIGTSPASGISLDIDGTARANSFVNSSDIRKKDVIDYDVDPGFETVANAPTIRFTWKDRGMLDNRGECVGSIAQYWQMALPEAVMTDSDGYMSMQYDVIALIAAVSVAKRVASHEQRIKELERENALLRMDIKALKGEA